MASKKKKEKTARAHKAKREKKHAPGTFKRVLKKVKKEYAHPSPKEEKTIDRTMDEKKVDRPQAIDLIAEGAAGKVEQEIKAAKDDPKPDPPKDEGAHEHKGRGFIWCGKCGTLLWRW